MDSKKLSTQQTMRQDNSKDPILQGIFKKIADVPHNDGYVFKSVDEANVEGETPLHIAAVLGDLEMGKILLDAGANPNWPAEHTGDTPLHKATSEKKCDLVDLLLSRGASQEIKNDAGFTALDLAKQSNDFRLIKVFSSWPISSEKSQRPEVFAVLKDASSTADNAGYVFKNAQDTNGVGDTALHVVTRRGDVEAGKILLDLGADPNAQGEHGYAPIHEAVLRKNYDLVKLLLEHGASKEIRNDDGFTPANYAEQSGDSRLKEIFQKNMA